MKNFLILLFIIIFYTEVFAKTEVLFTPSVKCENKIEQLINNTEHNLDIVVYSINNNKIVDAIERAYERGIKIRILTDKLQASGRYSLVTRLYKKGINIRVHSIHKIEHNKFAIYDGKTVSTGSYNWTNPASYKNSENCLFIINNRQTIEDYQNRFNYLWKINKKSKSDKWFDKKLKL